MTDAVERSDVAGFKLANARLLVAQSRARIDTWKLLKKHTEEHCRASRELLQRNRSPR